MFNNFFRQTCRLWDNVEKYSKAGLATVDNTIQNIRFACWISEATRTHWEYAILISCVRQRWFREGSMLICIRVRGLSRSEVLTADCGTINRRQYLFLSSSLPFAHAHNETLHCMCYHGWNIRLNSRMEPTCQCISIYNSLSIWRLHTTLES